MNVKTALFYLLLILSSLASLITYVFLASSMEFIQTCTAEFGAALPFSTRLIFNAYDFMAQHPFTGCLAFFFIPSLCILLALLLHLMKELTVIPIFVSIIPLVLCFFCFFSSYLPFLKMASFEEEFTESKRLRSCTFEEALFKDIRENSLSLS